jgi:hypothetical protein
MLCCGANESGAAARTRGFPRTFPRPPCPNPTCVFRYASGSPLALVAKPAFDGGHVFARLSQGHLTRAKGAKDLPPCLLGRVALCELREKGTSLAHEWSDEPTKLSKPKRAKRRVRVGRRDLNVPVLVAKAEDFRLVVLDDDQWPLILERDDGDENFWKLTAIG